MGAYECKLTKRSCKEDERSVTTLGRETRYDAKVGDPYDVSEL